MAREKVLQDTIPTAGQAAEGPLFRAQNSE